MMKRFLQRFILWRLQKIDDRNFMLILSAVVGVLSGLSAWVLKTGVFYMHRYFQNDLHFNIHNLRVIFYPIIGIGITLLFKQFILRDHIGHNIPSILHAIAKRNSLMRVHKIYSSVIGAIFTAGFGGSIGLESPIISSGSSIGSNLAKAFRLDYKSITTLLGCGAAGAISAIFNTPIAGIVFALEVLSLDMNRFSLIPLLIASVTGSITTDLIFPSAIFFEFSINQPFLVRHVHYYILFGILAGVTSNYFTRLFLYIENLFEKIPNRIYKLLIGAPLLGILVFTFPALYGEGFESIKLMLSGNAHKVFSDSLFSGFADTDWIFVLFYLALILLKVIATSLTLGAGGIGGIFAPSLFTGAILGFLFAWTNNHFLNEQLSVTNFSLVGMASVLGGVLQAPLTGIFLIAEITSGYKLIIPLMLSTTLSFIATRFLIKNSIITMQLAKRGELITHDKDKAVLQFLQVKDLVETDFFPINEDASLKGLIKAISISKRNIFPIINKDGYLIGIILLDDVREIMFNEKWHETPVVNLMQLPPAIVDMKEHMEQVMKKFNDSQAWNLPVCEKGRYIGFVSKSKLFTAYRSQLMNITEE